MLVQCFLSSLVNSVSQHFSWGPTVEAGFHSLYCSYAVFLATALRGFTVMEVIGCNDNL
jgi:hypothetical protein